MEKLEPCPFCGNKDVYITPLYDQTGWMTDYYKVVCEECNIAFEGGEGVGVDAVVKAWNKRASVD